jgi:NAD(P)-dependent dehydrogenase (short-subunit alcohol dehydrogenase family)
VLAGRVILVTGSGRGVGAGIARTLARHGAAVAVNYSSSAKEAQAVAEAVTEAGGRARCYQADVRDPAAVEQMVTSVEADFGRLDGIVNNAIAGVQEAAFEDARWSDYTDGSTLARRGRPEDVGDVCAFYLSDLGAAVTGAYLIVAGGRITQAGN